MKTSISDFEMFANSGRFGFTFSLPLALANFGKLQSPNSSRHSISYSLFQFGFTIRPTLLSILWSTGSSGSHLRRDRNSIFLSKSSLSTQTRSLVSETTLVDFFWITFSATMTSSCPASRIWLRMKKIKATYGKCNTNVDFLHLLFFKYLERIG